MNVALSIARKDLQIEWRTRMLLARVVPFALLVMVLFAVALDSEPLVLRAAAGLVWLAMLFSTMLVVQRAFDIETADAAIDTLLACAVHPARVFFGKALALFVQLFALAVVLVTAEVVGVASVGTTMTAPPSGAKAMPRKAVLVEAEATVVAVAVTVELNPEASATDHSVLAEVA